jgi:hypothetical protein
MEMLRMLNRDPMKGNKLLRKTIPKDRCSQLKPSKIRNPKLKRKTKRNDEVPYERSVKVTIMPLMEKISLVCFPND